MRQWRLLFFLKDQSGSALAASLAVIFILLTLFFSVFAATIGSKMIIVKRILKERSSYLADSGIARYLYTLNRDSLDWKSAVNLRITDAISSSESFSVKSEIYGGYLMVASVGKAGTQSLQKRALIGKAPWPDLNCALINGDLNYPLVVAGQTKIVGDVMTGPAGVVQGSVHGEANQENNPISGNVEVRQFPSFPSFDHDVMEHVDAQKMFLFDNPTHFLSGSQVIREIDLAKDDTAVSFLIDGDLELQSLKLDLRQTEMAFYARGSVFIKQECRFNGPLRIFAGGSIIIDGSVQMDGGLLYARDSVFFQRCRFFQGQALAGIKIIVGDGAHIEYPSLLYVYAANHNKDDSHIYFYPKSRSQAIAVIEKRPPSKDELIDLIKVDTAAEVTGCLISEDLTELRGVLFGLSITRSYNLQLPPTRYINWLYRTSIDRTRLDFLPVMPLSVTGVKQYAVFDFFEE
jgi:hypothetical protein